MRLIDADALREDMQWAIDHGMYDKPYDYLAEIDDAPTIGGWIPVSEKLPSEDQKCLVCHKGAIGIDEFIGHDLPYKWRIYLRDYDAWMPLPEPYKESDAK